MIRWAGAKNKSQARVALGFEANSGTQGRINLYTV